MDDKFDDIAQNITGFKHLEIKGAIINALRSAVASAEERARKTEAEITRLREEFCSYPPDARGKWQVIDALSRVEAAESRCASLEKERDVALQNPEGVWRGRWAEEAQIRCKAEDEVTALTEEMGRANALAESLRQKYELANSNHGESKAKCALLASALEKIGDIVKSVHSPRWEAVGDVVREALSSSSPALDRLKALERVAEVAKRCVLPHEHPDHDEDGIVHLSIALAAVAPKETKK